MHTVTGQGFSIFHGTTHNGRLEVRTCVHMNVRVCVCVCVCVCVFAYIYIYIYIYIQGVPGGMAKLRESVPYVELYRYNPKH